MTGGFPVALVADEDPGWGGIGTYTEVLARGLAELGHRVHVILRGWEEDSRHQDDGLVVHRLVVADPTWRRGTVAASSRVYETRESIVFSARVARLVARLATEQGLVLVEAPEFHAINLVSAFRRRLLRRPPAVVTRLHTPSYLTARMDREPWTVDLLAQELLEHASVRTATAISAPSAALADQVCRRWRLRRRRIQVVPNPIDVELFAPAGNDPVPASILVAGRVEPRKGQELMVEALPAIRAAVPGVRLWLVGDDSREGAATAALQRRARALGLEEEAIVADGAVPRSALPEIYRSAAVCVVPSAFENFPYTCLEAMACGRPVVGSQEGGTAEMIGDGKDGRLFPPGDVDALADVVARILSDEDDRERMGRAARETVLRRYATPVIARQMSELYTATQAPS